MLEGGFPAWEAAGLPIDTAPLPTTASAPTASLPLPYPPSPTSTPPSPSAGGYPPGRTCTVGCELDAAAAAAAGGSRAAFLNKEPPGGDVAPPRLGGTVTTAVARDVPSGDAPFCARATCTQKAKEHRAMHSCFSLLPGNSFSAEWM
jgi:hypothetical protein